MSENRSDASKNRAIISVDERKELTLPPINRDVIFGCLKKIEMSALTKERKVSIFESFGGKATNTGSIEAQVAILTERISHISSHLKENKKDFSSNRGLMQLVGKRKRLLSYLSKTNLQGYRALIEKLGLRK
jgi:small subunit ribosomal protein S15